MRVLLTGAAGMLGRDVERACELRGHDGPRRSTRADLDITDAAAVDAAIAGVAPRRRRQLRRLDRRRRRRGPTRTRRRGSTARRAGLVASRGRERRRQGRLPLDRLRLRRATSGSPYVESDITAPLSAYGRSQARRRDLGRDRQRAPFHRPLVVALRRRAGATSSRRCCAIGADQPEVIVVSDQVGCPTYTAHLAGLDRGAARGRRLRRPSPRRRRLVLVVRVRAGDLRPGRARVPGDGRHHRHADAQGAAARATRCSAASATDAVRLPSWRQGLAAYLRRARDARGRRAMKLLVAGGAGFIGSGYVRHRLATHPDDTVRVFDKLTYAGRPREPGGPAEDRVELVEGDIADRDAVAGRDRGLRRGRQLRRRVARRPLDRVAGRVHHDRRLRRLRPARGGARRRHPPPPDLDRRGLRLDRVGLVHRESPLDPSSPYSASKAGGDLIVSAFHHTYGADALIVPRARTTTGPTSIPRS